VRTEPVQVSVVVPVYNCDGCLRALHERLAATLVGLVEDWELVLVDDGSTDRSWATLSDLTEEDEHVRAIKLSRNFGQHAAITAGMAEARGRWTVVMDCDLQDPPEAIRDLYEKALEGHDVVFARRRVRRQSALRRLANRAYFQLRRRLVGFDIETEHSNLSMISAKARAAFLSIHDQHRNFLLILYWLGFERATIEFEHAPRYSGRSSYTLRKLIQVGLDGLFFNTAAILRWIVYVGFPVASSSVVLAGFYVYQYFARTTYPGWTSLAVLLLLIGGFIIIAIGVTGLYLGKVFEQVKARPLYLVDERLGWKDRDGELHVTEGEQRVRERA